MGRWVLLGEAALPDDAAARAYERGGRRWLVASNLFWPVPRPIPLAARPRSARRRLRRNGCRCGRDRRRRPIGVVLSAAYALVLWRGFRGIRRAKQTEPRGGTVACSSSCCDVTHLGEDAASRSDQLVTVH